MKTPSSETKTSLKKGTWSHEEDELLKSYINKYGIWNWTHMPRFAGLSRSGKSCRLRWMNYLKPNVKRGNFSQEDEEIILQFHSILGNKWSAIASKLPGRSDNEIKNYWHTHLKKRAIHNVCEAIEQNDVNESMSFEADCVENIQKPYNEVNDLSESTSSSISSTYNDDEVNFKADYYDIGSPGTVEDLQCFFKQLCPSENFDFGNIYNGSYNDANSYGFYNNDYDTINQASY